MGNNSIINLGARVGLYSAPDEKPATLRGVTNQSRILAQLGGRTQQERLIKDTKKSLNRALTYSYQSAFVRKVCCETGEEPVRALINANKLSQEYDEKIFATGFEHDFKCGDIFEWVNTGTYWILYLQHVSQIAYFRAQARRCDYQLVWYDEDGMRRSTYAAVKGPSEISLNSRTAHQIVIDQPSYTLTMLIPSNDDTKAYFKRYSRFFLGDICWKVEALDTINLPGIIEVNAAEDYINEQADDVEAGIVGGNLELVDDPNNREINKIISGESFIKPKIEYEYIYTGEGIGDWHYKADLPISAVADGNKIKLTWRSTYTGQFDLSFGDYTKTIVVQSLF